MQGPVVGLGDKGQQRSKWENLKTCKISRIRILRMFIHVSGWTCDNQQMSNLWWWSKVVKGQQRLKCRKENVDIQYGMLGMWLAHHKCKVPVFLSGIKGPLRPA